MVRLFFALWDDFKPRATLLYAFQQNGGGSVSGGVGEQFHAFGLQIMGAQGANEVSQSLGTVAEGETAAVADQTGGTGAQFVEGTLLLTAGGATAGAAVEGEIGGIGDDQIKLPGR